MRFVRLHEPLTETTPQLIALLENSDPHPAAKEFYNSLEAPVLTKYPLLALIQEFLKAQGAIATLMSGSGSTTFALVQTQTAAEELCERFKTKFGQGYWTAIVPL